MTDSETAPVGMPDDLRRILDDKSRKWAALEILMYYGTIAEWEAAAESVLARMQREDEETE